MVSPVPSSTRSQFCADDLQPAPTREEIAAGRPIQELVAYSSVHRFRNTGALEWKSLAVDPRYQRRGIGRALGDEIIERCRALVPGCEAWIRLFASPRIGAANHYRKPHGFEGDTDDLLSLKISASK